LQEYIKINTPVLDAIAKISSDSACLSDAARSWYEIKEHFAKLNSSEIRCISDMPRQDLATLQALAAQRVDDGLKDVLCLALLLDPRPSMRAFVTRLLGSAGDLSLGATDYVAAAVRAIKAIADGITVANKSSAEVGLALAKALQIFLGCALVRIGQGTARLTSELLQMQMQACALCSMIDGSGPGINYSAMSAEILIAGSCAGAL
jgi:hypothetical protein